MIRLLRGLPSSVEFAIVVVVAFGYFVVGSVLWFVQDVRDSGPDNLFQNSIAVITAEHLSFLNLYEPIIFLLLVSFLYFRGWTIQRLGAGSLRFHDFLVGLTLAVIPILMFFGTILVVALIEPETLRAAVGNADPAGEPLALPTVLLSSIINPIYEETFVCGYVISALSGRTRAWQAVGVSIAIRVLYHLYLGTLGAVNAMLVGLVFGLWYAWKVRLWPLVIAHAILDFIALAP